MRTRLLFLLFFCTLIFHKANGQGWEWMKGAHGESQGTLVVTDKDRNVYNTGQCWYAGSFGPYPFAAYGGIAWMPLVKYDSSGNIHWAMFAKFASSCGLSVDPFGNIYVLGVYKDTVLTLDGKSITNPNPPYSATHIDSISSFIAKINAGGNVVWLKNIGDINVWGSTMGNALAIDSCGNLVVAVNFIHRLNIGATSFIAKDTGAARAGDILVAKFDTAGNFLWGKQYGGKRGDHVSGLSLSASGDIFLAGTFASDTLHFGSTSIFPVSGQGGAFVAKLTETGDAVWARAFTIDDSVSASATGLNVDSYGDVFVTGYYSYRGALTPPPIATINSFPLPLGRDRTFSFLFKISSTSTPLWGKSIRGYRVFSYGPAIDGCGNVWIHCANGVHTDNEVLSDTVDGHIITAPPINSSPAFILAFSNTGTYMSALTLASGAVNWAGITTDASGKIYATAYAAMDTFVVAADTVYDFPSTSHHKMYVAKYDPALGCYRDIVPPHDCSSTVAASTISPAHTLALFPDPANDILNIEAAYIIESISILDLRGTVVLRAPAGPELHKQALDIRHLAPGLYLVRVNNSICSKFIKQ